MNERKVVLGHYMPEDKFPDFCAIHVDLSWGGRLSHSKQVLRETVARRGSGLHLRICGQLQVASGEYLSC
jgi:hypothetical protein